MKFDARGFYELLPAIHRLRDAERGEPLRALLAVIAEQAALLEEDLETLYEDQFIETCAEWVVPYLGDLIGHRALHGVTAAVASQRAEVANTIACRRRKGTAAMLEQLARDVTGWNARAVEFFQRLGTTQYMNHVRPGHACAPDLRRWESLERLDTAFDSLSHTVEVRSVSSGEGRYNIPNIGIFLWRLEAHRLSDSPAAALDARRFFFSPLGNDTPLFTRPETEPEITHLATPLNVPMPITRRALDASLPAYFGRGKSIHLRVDGVEIGPGEIAACNLSDAPGGSGAWAHEPASGIAVDPVLGRIAFPAGQAPSDVRVTFHHGFGRNMGGGEYERRATFHDLPVSEVAAPAAIQDALDALESGGGSGAVQIADSGRYAETLRITAGEHGHVELRAANEQRPTLVLGGDLEIRGGEGSEVTLNGLLLIGGALRVSAPGPAAGENRLRRLQLRHCTLVPGRALTSGSEPVQPGVPSLIIETPDVAVKIEDSIVGALRIADGSSAIVSGSIVDATGESEVAYAAPDGASAGGALEILSSTVFGKIHAVELPLVSNSILFSRLAAAGETWSAPVRVQRRQTGCVRFSWLPLASVAPRRHRCQPDTEIAKQIDARTKGPPLSDAARAAISAEVAARLVPAFTARRYGLPGYGQLRASAPAEIRTGADDGSEMGAFHSLFAPQRETNLRVRLDEYLRFGLEAGIFYVT